MNLQENKQMKEFVTWSEDPSTRNKVCDIFLFNHLHNEITEFCF